MKIGLSLGGWSRLLNAVGAKPQGWTSVASGPAREPSWRVELTTRGIDVDLSQVEIDLGTGVYTYRGQQICIYIKDTRKPADVLRSKADAVRFHVSDCRTIDVMKEKNRFQRYVAIARTDGRFPVFSREMDGQVQELEVELAVCKNCLSDINFDGYADAAGAGRDRIWQRFSLATFYQRFSSQLSIIPRDSCSALPESDYVADWPAVSRSVRERSGWRCTSCRVVLDAAKQLLHVHHKDKDKSNNRLSNLSPLCILCHALEPGHESMYVNPKDRERVIELRSEQGLTGLARKRW